MSMATARLMEAIAGGTSRVGGTLDRMMENVMRREQANEARMQANREWQFKLQQFAAQRYDADRQFGIAEQGAATSSRQADIAARRLEGDIAWREAESLRQAEEAAATSAYRNSVLGIQQGELDLARRKEQADSLAALNARWNTGPRNDVDLRLAEQLTRPSGYNNKARYPDLQSAMEAIDELRGRRPGGGPRYGLPNGPVPYEAQPWGTEFGADPSGPTRVRPNAGSPRIRPTPNQGGLGIPSVQPPMVNPWGFDDEDNESW